jgi:4-amino-4-deoxy-L-arabinose transferase-like glycosyltransferase
VENNQKKTSRLARIGLICLILILVGINVFWLLTSYVPYVNQDWVLVHPLKMHRLIEDGQLARIASVSNYYPPFTPFVTAISTFYLFGASDFSSLLSFNIFFVILLLSVYGIGKVLHNEWVGLFAAAIAGLMPIINNMSRTYNWDFPLGAMVCLSIYLLLRSEDFSSRKYSLLFGVSAGLGLLTKWSFFCFVIGPAVYALYRGMRYKRRYVLVNSGLSALIGLAIACVWYVPNISISTDLVTNVVANWNSLPWYGYIFFLQAQMLVPMAIAGIFSFFYYCLRCKNWTIFWWIIIPYIILSMITSKMPRYTLPYLPAFAIAISYSVLSLTRRNRLLRIVSCSAIIALMTVLLLSYSAGIIIPKEVTHGPLCFVWRSSPTRLPARRRL